MKGIPRNALSLVPVAVLAAGSVHAAVLTLDNAGFQTSGHDSTPSGWTAGGPNGGHFVYASGGGIPAGVHVLGIKRPDNWVQQSFDTNEATADTFSQFTVSFDSGWRNNTSSTNRLGLTFELVNVTDGGTLASATYIFPPDTPSELLDNYRVIQTGNVLDLTYDNSLPSLVGDEIALRLITTSDTVNSFNPTGWIDNLEVSAVPEPGSLLLVATWLGVAVSVRRRRTA